MPLEDQSLLGTEIGGECSTDYCLYCYEAGEFKQPHVTFQEMVDMCVSYLQKDGVAAEEARHLLTSFLPSLKRWRKGGMLEPVIIEKEAFQIMGITARTSNADELTAQTKNSNTMVCVL
ncbi:zinc ribbon domain-containing protein [Pontibacillus litoralis]|uniref:zinc ribbon domain-containing protein n=1 Tax=Pontibacillus litoralis TaxID=516703 RepID=UPI000AF09964|nr:zinc ribbon domain-containing protein [Pontibacillus litoralis]